MSTTTRSIVIAAEAEAEAVQAYEWYKEEAGAEAAHGFRVAMRSAIFRAGNRPDTYPKFEGEVRRCLFEHYPDAVLYELTSAAIIVVAVMHFKRRPGYWKDR